MEENINIEDPEYLLLDYFSGTLLPSQKKAVEAWIEQSEQNRKIAQDIKYIYLTTETINDIRTIDSEKALRTVKTKISKRKKVSFYTICQRIAAILILPLLVSTIYFATKEEPNEYIEVRTNPGMITVIQLSDSTKVWLNSRSFIKYPRKFQGKTRQVELNGEAYFSVHKDKSKKFIVNTPFNLKAEVLGTEFNIDAYKENNTITTTLISGSVKLSFQDKEHQEQSLVMKPNEEISYNNRTGNIKTREPYIPTLTAWKDGMVIFRNTPFEDALKILSKRFNVDFIVKNDALYKNSFTGPFDGQHLPLILEHFRISSGIQYHFIDPETKQEKEITKKTVVELY